MPCLGEFGASACTAECPQFMPSLDEFLCSRCHHNRFRHRTADQQTGKVIAAPMASIQPEPATSLSSPSLSLPSSPHSPIPQPPPPTTAVSKSVKKKSIKESETLKTKRAQQWVYVKGLGYGTVIPRHTDTSSDADSDPIISVSLCNADSSSKATVANLPRSLVTDSLPLSLHTFYTRANHSSTAENATLLPSQFTVIVNLNDSIAESIIHPLMDYYASINVIMEEEELRIVSRGREIAPPPPTSSAQASVTLKSHTTLIAESLIDPFQSLLLIYDPQSSFTLDSSTCGPNLTVSNDMLNVAIHSDSKWCSIRSNVGFSRGLHQWRLRMNQCASGNVFVGVCTDQAKMTQYLGNDNYGYGFYGCGNTYRQGSSKSYGHPYRTGDIITVILDCDQHKLSFKKQTGGQGSEESLGVAFDDLPSTTLYPAISLYSRDDSVTIIDSM